MTSFEGRLAVDSVAAVVSSRTLDAESSRLAASSRAVSTSSAPSVLSDDGGAFDDPLREAFEQCFVGPAAATTQAAIQVANNLACMADNVRQAMANFSAVEADIVEQMRDER
jgi:hypothetical protein